MINLRLSSENKYNLFVQLDYLGGICTGVVLGLCLANELQWYMFVILLVASLCLGVVTVKSYQSMIKHMLKEKK